MIRWWRAFGLLNGPHGEIFSAFIGRASSMTCGFLPVIIWKL